MQEAKRAAPSFAFWVKIYQDNSIEKPWLLCGIAHPELMSTEINKAIDYINNMKWNAKQEKPSMQNSQVS